MAVEVIHFNPMRPTRSGFMGRFSRRAPLNNFGDLIGPRLVARIVEELGLHEPAQRKRLISVGSIMKMAQPGDVVWGTGINGKSMSVGAGASLDIRAVRGPRTREVLRRSGASVPEVYGDPALLWSRFWSRETYLSSARPEGDRVAIVPNFHDYPLVASDPRVVNPCSDLESVISRIANSEFVCGSSLHGIVIAESFGIPARLVTSGVEPVFKYDDYYGGTGREDYRAATSVEEALRLGGERPIDVDLDALFCAFPADLWTQS